MKIVFIANYHNGPGGEVSDETHLAREMEALGHTVYRIPRDEWREYVIENSPKNKYHIPEDIQPDIVLVSKWHHFYDGQFIRAAKLKWSVPVMYWVWDFMERNASDNWHILMAKEADLYLSGELGLADHYRSHGIKFYYFQFDSCDGQFPPMHDAEKVFDVVFLGSHTNQNGRLDILKKINEKIKIQVFAYDYDEWRKDGFQAAPAAYSQEFNDIVAHSRIILGTSAGPECFGYWSNRVGKVLHAGGFLLQWYTPGMELFLADCCDYFGTAEEAVEKINFYLSHPEEIEKFWNRNVELGRVRWTSAYKIRQLTVLFDRYLKEDHTKWMLP